MIMNNQKYRNGGKLYNNNNQLNPNPFTYPQTTQYQYTYPTQNNLSTQDFY